MELLQNTLKRLLYYKETELILPTMSCALEIAEKSQLNLKHTAINLNVSLWIVIIDSPRFKTSYIL